MQQISKIDLSTRMLFLCIGAFVFTLPFSIRTSNVFLIVTVVYWLFFFKLKSKIMVVTPLVLLLGYFLINVLGILNSEDTSLALKNTEKQIPFLLLPLLVSGTKFSECDKIRLFKLYYLAIIAAAFYCICFELVLHYKIIGRFYPMDFDFFKLSELTQGIAFDPPYFGMYIGFAIVIGLDLFLRKEITFKSFLLSYCFLLFFLILSGARTAILISFITQALYLIVIYRKAGILFATMVTIGVILFIYCDDVLSRRFVDSFTLSRSDTDKTTSLQLRVSKWYSAANVFLLSPIFGVGLGDAQEALNQEYLKNNLQEAYNRSYNAHNQFLQTAVTSGSIGLFALLSIFYIGYREAIKQRDWVFFSFLLISFACFFSESILERQKGIVFFSLFYSVFTLRKYK